MKVHQVPGLPDSYTITESGGQFTPEMSGRPFYALEGYKASPRQAASYATFDEARDMLHDFLRRMQG